MNRLVVFLLAFVISSLAGPLNDKVAADLRAVDQDSTLDVIVQYKGSPEHWHRKVERHGGRLKADLNGAIRGSAYRLPARALELLVEDPEVQYISPDRTLNATLDYSTAAVNAGTAWQYGFTGSGIAVGVIDSGISNHPDLKNSAGALRVVYSQDFIGGGTDDHYGHGEHVAGIIAGDGASSIGSIDFRSFRGMAPAANIVNLRVLDQNGQGTDSAVIAAINTAINLKDRYNIRVINLSLGRPVYESYTLDPLCQAVESAWKAGIVVVVAAGNEGRNNSAGTNGYGTIMAPGNDPYVITVGAMKTMGTYSRSDDLIASYSSKGPTQIDHIVKPDLVAPGNRVVSLRASTATLPSVYPANTIRLTSYQKPERRTSNEYFTLSGTSMATPVVSGAAVLLLQQNASLTPDQVKARLMKTAYKSFPASSVAVDPVTNVSYTSQYDIFTIGAGYLDVAAAVSSTDLAPNTAGSAASPTAYYDSNSGNVYVKNTATSVARGSSSNLE